MRISLNFQTLFQPLLTGLAVIFLLAACSPNSTPIPSTDTPAPRAAPTLKATETAVPAQTAVPTPTRLPHLQLLPEDLEGTRIRFWHPWSGAMAELLQQKAEEFNRINSWGIAVEVTAPGGSGLLFEQVTEQLSEQTAPNVVAASMEQILTWHRLEGVAINLNDYVDDSVWGLNPQERADFPRSFWDQGELEGRRYGIPAMRSPEVLFYNADWARELGFPNPPGTVQEFKAQACAAAAANKTDADTANDGTGGWIVNTDAMVQLAWMHSFGFTGFQDDNSIRFNLRSTRELFTFLRTMFDEGCAWSARLPEPYEYFATRRALFYSGTLYDLPQQEFHSTRFNQEDEWTILPYPATNGGRPVVITSGQSYAVLASGAEEQLAAWLFIRWLTLSQNQAPMAELSGAWPASVEALDELADYRQAHPAWDRSLLWIPVAQPAPVHPEWRLVRGVLSDAAWQLYQTNIKLEDISNLLNVLDATAADVLENAR
jgi:ABC-type glycerol-3-phosphate transport system substrate-binding protein